LGLCAAPEIRDTDQRRAQGFRMAFCSWKCGYLSQIGCNKGGRGGSGDRPRRGMLLEFAEEGKAAHA
jgi:hypothetical protein